MGAALLILSILLPEILQGRTERFVLRSKHSIGDEQKKVVIVLTVCDQRVFENSEWRICYSWRAVGGVLLLCE